jgi:hypothetical protein
MSDYFMAPKNYCYFEMRKISTPVNSEKSLVKNSLWMALFSLLGFADHSLFAFDQREIRVMPMRKPRVSMEYYLMNVNP